MRKLKLLLPSVRKLPYIITMICCVTFVRISYIRKGFPADKDVDNVVTAIDEEYAAANYTDNCQAVIKDYNISMSNYVMALSHREQLTMATENLCALVNLARGWQSRVVTPFTLNSQLYGLPSTDDFPVIASEIVERSRLVNQGPTKPLSIIYDMKQLNSDLFCRKYSLPPLASFSEFIRYANRRIILIHTDTNPISSSFPHGGKYMDCGKYWVMKTFVSKLLRVLNAEAKKLKSPPFHFDSACCIPTNNVVIESPLEIAEGCGFFPSTSNISIIFTRWYGYYKEKKHPLVLSHRLVVADTPIFKAPSTKTDVFPLSQGIINNASAFVNFLSCGSDKSVEFVAVHFRTEKLQVHKKDFESCFKATLQFMINDSVQKSCSQQQNCMEKCHRYFVDYGEFGSQSFWPIISYKYRRTIKKMFEQNNIEPVHYDPRKYGGVLDSGFVAKVEQLAIANSSMLILVGDGSFQTQLLFIFKKLGHGANAYRVCHTKEVELVFTRKAGTK